MKYSCQASDKLKKKRKQIVWRHIKEEKGEGEMLSGAHSNPVQGFEITYI